MDEQVAAPVRGAQQVGEFIIHVVFSSRCKPLQKLSCTHAWRCTASLARYRLRSRESALQQIRTTQRCSILVELCTPRSQDNSLCTGSQLADPWALACSHTQRISPVGRWSPVGTSVGIRALGSWDQPPVVVCLRTVHCAPRLVGSAVALPRPSSVLPPGSEGQRAAGQSRVALLLPHGPWPPGLLAPQSPDWTPVAERCLGLQHAVVRNPGGNFNHHEHITATPVAQCARPAARMLWSCGTAGVSHSLLTGDRWHAHSLHLQSKVSINSHTAGVPGLLNMPISAAPGHRGTATPAAPVAPLEVPAGCRSGAPFPWRQHLAGRHAGLCRRAALEAPTADECSC